MLVITSGKPCLVQLQLTPETWVQRYLLTCVQYNPMEKDATVLIYAAETEQTFHVHPWQMEEPDQPAEKFIFPPRMTIQVTQPYPLVFQLNSALGILMESYKARPLPSVSLKFEKSMRFFRRGSFEALSRRFHCLRSPDPLEDEQTIEHAGVSNVQLISVPGPVLTRTCLTAKSQVCPQGPLIRFFSSQDAATFASLIWFANSSHPSGRVLNGDFQSQSLEGLAPLTPLIQMELDELFHSLHQFRSTSSPSYPSPTLSLDRIQPRKSSLGLQSFPLEAKRSPRYPTM